MNQLENSRSRNSSTGRSRARGTNKGSASEEAHRLVILHALEEVIPPDAAADTTERKGQITRSLLLQV